MTMIEKVARAIARSIDIAPDDGRAEDAMKLIRITAIELMYKLEDEGYDVMINAVLKED